MTVWRRGDFEVKLIWGDPSTRTHVSDRLKMAMCKDRWQRIANQESAPGVEQGIDWTIPRKLLKQAAKRPLVAAGLRMLCQGAIRRAGHGGDLLYPRCNAENTLRHVLHDCPRWAVFDLGPDPCLGQTVSGTECFQVRGLVPKQATVHPDLTPAQMTTQYHGLLKSKPLPVSGVFFGTDASGGPRGADPRLRVVSWAVVAVRVTTRPVNSNEEGTYELLGTMTGTFQVGATVNEGEQVAINKLAEWVTTLVRSSSDSKVAIKRCLKANIHETLPQVWSTSSAQRELLQLDQRPSRCYPALSKVWT